MTRLPGLLAISLLMTTPALAAHAADKAGFALSAGIGPSRIKDRDGSDTFDAGAIGFTLGVEYRFNDYFALGANVMRLGTAEDEFKSISTEIEVKVIDVAIRAILPVSDSVEVFATAGVASYFADLDPGGSNLFGDDASELGLGVDFGRGEHMTLRLAARFFDGQRQESGSLVTVGFNYRF